MAYLQLAWPLSVQSILLRRGAFRVLVVKDFDRIAVEDTDKGAGKIRESRSGEN